MSKNLYIGNKHELLNLIKTLWNSRAENWLGYLIAAFSAFGLIYSTVISTKIKNNADNSIITHFENLDKLKLIVVFLLFIGLLFFLYSAFKGYSKNKENKEINTNFEQALDEISIPTHHTSLFIIRTKLNNKTNILTTYNIKEGYWLPYIQKQKK